MKRFFIALIGGTVLLVGLALLVLPGPGLPIIAAGLAILATEFFWARRAMRRAKGVIAKARRKSGLKEWLRRRWTVSPDKPCPDKCTKTTTQNF